MDYRKIILLFISAIAISANAQDKLLKEDAIRMAMESNFDIKIADNNVKIAQNNASLKNSQYLPKVTSTAGANYATTNGSATPRTGDPIDFTNNASSGLNMSLGLQYMIFDGFARKNAYKMLQTNYQISEVQARLMVENTLLAVFNSYYEVARLSQDVENRIQSLQVSRDRLKRAQVSADYGQGTSLNILNAEVDFNNDSITYLTNYQLLLQEKKNLNLLLGRDVNTDFTVDTSLSFNEALDLNVLLQHAQENNASLMQQELLLTNAEYNMNAVKANAIPKLSLNAGYNFNNNYFGAASFLESSSSIGPSVGLQLSWNIFDGGATSVRGQNAQIQLQNQQVTLNKQKLNVERNIGNAWTAYQTAIYVKNAQEKIVETATTNFNRSLEQYKLGQINNITFRQAQLNLLNAQLGLNRAKYSAKLAELNVLQISGDLKDAKF